MKRAIVFTLMVLAWTSIHSCRQEDRKGSQATRGTETLIQGTLSGGENMEVLLEEMGSREYIPVDTVRCMEDGSFHIAFLQESMAFYVLRTGGRGYLTLLLEPGEKLWVEGEYAQPESYRIQGSPGSEQLAILDSEHKRVLAELRGLSAEIREARDQGNYREIRMELDRRMDSLTGAFRAYSLSFIERNKPSPVMLIALYNLYGRDFPVFDPALDFDVYLKVDSLLQEAHPRLEAARGLHAQLLEIKSSIETEKAGAGPAVGQFAPDFVSSRPDGSSLALSDLKGQWVLLGFWAAWSNPSMEDTDFLKESFNAFRNRGFTILQVSFDSEKDKWTGAIREKKTDWHHVCDLAGWESPVADLYEIERIPDYYLVGPDGIVADRDFSAGEIKNKLQAILDK